jgi:hypothetical protein
VDNSAKRSNSKYLESRENWDEGSTMDGFTQLNYGFERKLILYFDYFLLICRKIGFPSGG